MNDASSAAPPADGPDAPGTVVRSLVLGCDRDHAWALIATEEGLARWLGTEVRLDPDVGGALELVDDEGRRRRGTVVDAHPAQSLTIAWALEDDEGVGSTVTLAVEEDDAGTRVTVVEERAGGSVACCADAGAAWDRRLLDLELDVAVRGPLAYLSTLVAV